MSRDPGGAEASAFLHALAAAPEGAGLGRGREGVKTSRGELPGEVSRRAPFRAAAGPIRSGTGLIGLPKILSPRFRWRMPRTTSTMDHRWQRVRPRPVPGFLFWCAPAVVRSGLVLLR